jgi:transcriptional regulator with XRE-family HTH domain
MLNRIARALNQKLTVQMTASDPEEGPLRHAFQTFVRDMRRDRGFTIGRLAKKTGINADEIRAMEQVVGYRPRPRTLSRLSEWSGIPLQALAALAGAYENISPSIRQSAIQFAARSESFSKLTTEEKQALDDLVRVLKTEAS